MTVSKLYDYMTEKVVPESVMPQNIAAVLMDDENPTLPELDAFTFLNRVRALGIGSADFLYLLKGCNAPAEAVEKIENNPAMNLQTLIVTLDGSGLTSQDYTRMLYTARQIWERTLTMRLDRVQAVPTEEDEEDYPYDEYEPEEETSGNTEDIYEENEAEAEEADDIPENDDFDYDDDIADNDDDEYDEESPYHKKMITASFICGGLLIGLCAAINYMGFERSDIAKPISQFSADSGELFAELHTAYNAGNIGGEALPFTRDDSVLFGTILIQQPDALGSYSLGASAFSAMPDSITVYISGEDSVSVKCTIAPPEGAEFVDIVCSEDKLTAVFADDDSAGFTCYDESGKALFTTVQMGALTDIYADKDSISLGTVYIPEYTESFTIEDTDKYLPVFTLDGEQHTIPHDRIITDGTALGCGYAVYGDYSLQNGEAISSTAALGSPVYSDAEEFLAVMRLSDGCRLISLDSEGLPEAKDIVNINGCAMGDVVMTKLSEDTEPYDSVLTPEEEQPLIATAEKAEDGTDCVYLRGIRLEPVSVISNIPCKITSLRIDGGILYIYDENGVAVTADISDPTAPKLVQFTAANGIVKEDLALCSELTDKNVKLTLYRRGEDRQVSEVSSSTVLTSSTDSSTSPQLCGGNTMYLGSEELCGAAYTYFDGVSVISEYTVFGKTNTSYTLFDDKNGFTAAAEIDGAVHLIYGESSYVINK